MFAISNLRSAVPHSLPPAETKLTAFEQCVARIKSVVKQVQLEVLSKRLSKLNCPITTDFPKDPVVTSCGHLFDKSAIQRWGAQGNPCALCRKPLTKLIPIHAFREFVEERLPKDPILTCSHFKGPNKQRADKCLELAKNCVDEKDYQEALEFYSKALQYTNSSADYAAIPELYEQLGESENATLSRLYLSLYQLQEGKVQEAIETLGLCNPAILNITPLVVGLELQLRPSPKNVEWAMTCALNQNNPEDSIFIYKQILAYAPNELDAYKGLIPLTKNQKEKRELQLKARELARVAEPLNLGVMGCEELGTPLISNAISRKEWAAPQTIRLPPYPQELEDFLAGNCTIWPGKKRWQTHIVVPLFPQVILDDVPIPFTLGSLGRLDKSSGGPGYRVLEDSLSNISAKKNFRYAVMTNDVIPKSRGLVYQEQLKLLPAGYEPPGAFDAARAILWEFRFSGNGYFSSKPQRRTYTCCKETVQGLPVWVGGLMSSGLLVDFQYYLVDEDLGIAGWQEFDL